MKTLRKVFAFALVLMLAMALTAPTFAQTQGTAAAGTGTITINNPSNGETYKIYRLFDASVSSAQNSGGQAVSIAYTLRAGMTAIPEGLTPYFSYDATTGAVTSTLTSLNDAAIAALKSWAENQDADAQAVSDGTVLVFQGVPYGYYVITSTQDGGSAITVDSTNPNASVYDKNTTPPIAGLTKTANDEDVFIGQVVTYTVSFSTSNFTGSGSAAKKIVSYTIHDTLPAFLENVAVDSITIGGNAYTVSGSAPQFDTDKNITIPWVDGSGNPLYTSGAQIVVTYHGTIGDGAAIAGAGNTNTVTISYVDEDGTPGGGGDDPDVDTKTSTVKTYAIAIKKVSDSGAALQGAVFQLPFYVKETAAADGAYIYGGTTAGTGLTNEVTTPVSGEIFIKGVASGTYNITELTAPDGYNKLADPVACTAVVNSQTTTSVTVYLDADGNIVGEPTTTVVTVTNNNLSASAAVVVNRAGTELPSTGGVGTTLFYVFGGLLVVGAAVVLVARKRVNE